MTLDKGLRIFALVWMTPLAILNAAAIVLLVPLILFSTGPRALMILVLFVALFVLDLLLSVPALAAEWVRSMRIAKTKFAILRKHPIV